jgi:sigma-B regulation protein RsbU (phosphoserine phosphatase)
MVENYHIILVGMKPPAEAFAAKHLSGAGYQVSTAATLSEVRFSMKGPRIDLIYLQPTSETSAIDELKTAMGIQSNLQVALVCVQASASLTLEAWHAGAADVLSLPLTAEILDASLGRALKKTVPQPTSSADASEARFRYLDETGKERWITIVAPRFTIGRSSNNDLVFSHMSISRTHCEIVLEGEEHILRDLGSKHGTYLNGVRTDQSTLRNGDRIQLGGLQGLALTYHRGDLLQTLLGLSDSKPDAGLAIRGFKEFGMLLATFRALSSIPLLDDLLSLVVDTAIELTGAERGFIMLKEQDDSLNFRCARNSYKRPLDGSFFQTSRRVPEEAFKTGNRVVINDLDLGENAADHSSTRRLGLRRVFCVPLRYLSFHDSGSMSGIGRMETIGVLYVDSQNIGVGLSNTQVEALETLASEAAMAIYNARLYKDSQEKRKMTEELSIAREIQQALLPQPNKTLPFLTACSLNLPCREVGGDYFDYFEMSEGRLGFALGDVAGKGMPAALLASVIQGIFSAQTLLDLPLPQMISNVNLNLVRRGTSNRFVTFFFGIVDPDGKCTYTNAGHNPPIVLSRDGSMCELTEGGMVLGLFGFAQYESRTIQLKSGDHLVLFTDGVMEALNTKGEEFGEERLRAVLQQNATASTEQILVQLQDAIATFSANTPQHDDITMMILGYKE